MQLRTNQPFDLSKNIKSNYKEIIIKTPNPIFKCFIHCKTTWVFDSSKEVDETKKRDEQKLSLYEMKINLCIKEEEEVLLIKWLITICLTVDGRK